MKSGEDQLQKACVRWFKLQHPKVRINHSPNGGNRNSGEAGKFKQMGVSPGFPDIAIYKRSGQYSGLAIELKVKYESGRKNYTSPEQRQWLEDLKNEGWSTWVAYTIDDFIKIVNEYLNGEYIKASGEG